MSTRTQIYLTEGQRTQLDALRRRHGKSLATLIREAVDQYLHAREGEAAGALEETFGKAPGLSGPSRDEWGKRG